MYNLVTNIENCYIDIPSILYYSHIPTAVLAMLIGLFVFKKDNYSLVSKILLLIGVLFSLWSVMDIILWLTYDSRVSMFFWSIINLFEMLVSVATLYFAYVFIEKKDVSLKFKLLIGGLLSVFVVLMVTRFNLTSFNETVCEGTQGTLIYYFYFLEGLFSSWLLFYLISRIIKSRKTEDFKKTIYFSIGILAFLLSFSGANIIGSALTAFNINILGNSDNNWKLLQYGLFGMTIFMGFLAYLIVKFKAFNIKLFGVQALVVALVALVASQYFFATSTTGIILTGVTLIITLGFGYFLVKSVLLEIRRKEELQMMADKLAAANDQLRKLDNAKTEFISIASHQLRTPLTSVKGFVSMIIEGSYGEISPQVKDALVKVYSSAERLVHLVEDLLNVSRIEAGRLQFSFEKGDVGQVMQEIHDNFMLVAKNKKMYLDLKMPKKLPQIVMDSSKIREVVSNLVDNAFKYTERGGVTMKAEVVGKEKIKITVSDTGIGIPKNETDNMFKKFSRGKDVTRLHASGTGLGLYVGKEIINAHKGKIWFESAGEGKGTKFFVELPITQEAA